MEKELGQVKFTETENGIRIEVTGKSLKEMYKCCCMPMVCAPKESESGCCGPADEKK
ncbi:MAG: hypothetical protein ABIK83_04730 [Candidatus Zixiibacteriota bacterium]